MNKVYACIDEQPGVATVIDWAAWAARRLGTPLELLHALERAPIEPVGGDLSGAIGLGAQEALLAQLSELDVARSQLAQQAGRQLLAAGQERARSAGASACEGHLRHGELVDVVLDAEPDARLFVLGQHYHDSRPNRRHLDHHLERVVRAAQRPVLVSTGAPFAPPTRFVIAYDGSRTAEGAVERVAQSPLLAGLTAELVRVGQDSPAHRQELEHAGARLRDAGFSVETTLLDGAAEERLPAHAQASGASLLVMGAYGHSRIRQLIIGSTTTALLRLSEIPVLVLR